MKIKTEETEIKNFVSMVLTGFENHIKSQEHDVSYTTPGEREKIKRALLKNGNFVITTECPTWNKAIMTIRKCGDPRVDLSNVIFVDFVNKKVIE